MLNVLDTIFYSITSPITYLAESVIIISINPIGFILIIFTILYVEYLLGKNIIRRKR